ncbi:YhcN/YlaJ family sporulation lipoprotein [Clostridium botulinum]|uniref:Forespore-specific lipoprotein n=1 Tax=Clostridium botulinum (strain Hall / ATCC 3502 / NCTC 13319 / Type A) TaxID=441771 RepID=A5HYT4_CLOBH|nr:YhcN/YlaJ family sporulation lipoprotein [Clostridium botulinum]EPS51836.1 forespore-specific lipoprotein [Clostridium botulinum CFSAN002367]AWB16304.1 YhcN/YlaJ family sporulation lipoprotein [Clostridium botulinum]AWB29120.1 YhcN/YlaJ family sporulation lipoprotein [Clostridium botulinum]EGT5616884.1 YhcN/YlaJ family sporulation lipoprotein [Clostridium botulinum]EGT5621444.1 YhcN/YlaJ family sporulation lipoprotein [Clostridium botulinum]
MIKNNKKLLFTTGLLSLSLLLGTGCTNKSAKNPPANNATKNVTEKANENTANKNAANGNATNENAKDGTSTGENINGNTTVTDGDLSRRSQKIADELVKIKGIEKARVVISERRALVGVTIPNSVEGKMTSDLKKKVDETVKKTDKEIDTVAVSADADVYDRITKIADGIKGGRGIQEFGTEFKELFNRIIPQ